MKKQLLIIIAVAALVILGVGLWFYFSKQPKKAEEAAVPSEVQSGFGAEIGEKVGENPAAKMPETNPFKKELNPLEGVYKNPFE